MNKNVRNVLIVFAIAALVVVVPGGGKGANVAIQVISLAFLAAIGWVASLMYREHRLSLYALGDRRRAVLYVAAGIAALTLTATSRLLHTGPGTVVWLVLLGGAAYAALSVVWAARKD